MVDKQEGVKKMVRVRAEERRQELIAAASAIIAERGVDELRTREVAAHVGITHASLHYHFPSKTDLIRAVLDDVIGRQIVQPVINHDGPVTAAQRLRALLSTLTNADGQEPQHVVVLKELHRYADRDNAARALLEPWLAGWRVFLVDLLATGQREGDFRADLDPAATASVIMLVILGLRLGGVLAPEADQALADQIHQLLAPPSAAGLCP
ncbi:TetR/AcrR family transcriptional regulator [Spongiactinospora sp. 9N601]|uniref:TetR/AcrR family transcriptional regulator n=1 Tax=Spongiactinospora sp. 9N601 TaxID=3375149 RepID=UPI00379D7657